MGTLGVGSDVRGSCDGTGGNWKRRLGLGLGLGLGFGPATATMLLRWRRLITLLSLCFPALLLLDGGRLRDSFFLFLKGILSQHLTDDGGRGH